MVYNLTKFQHYDGTTTSDIMPSLVRFECVNGVLPEMGSLTVVLNAPVLDTSGNTITLDRGDVLWPYFYQAAAYGIPTGWACPMAGYVTDIKQEGDTLTITAESLVTPLLRSTFSGSYTANPYAYSILTDIVDGYTPPISHEVYQFFALYRPAYGAAQIPIDQRIDNVSFDKTQVAAIYQYFSEFPASASLANVLSTAFAYYYIKDSAPNLPLGMGIQWSGYGNHPISASQLTYDNYLLSMVQWKDSAESVLNDVTIKTKGTGLYQKTDAASIAAHGQRATTLYRPMYTDVTYAQVHADTMVAALKDPKVRCSATLDANALIHREATGLNWVFQIVDDVAGRTEDVVLSKFTLRWPEMIAECEFDNAAISLNRAGLRMDNRVTNLEAAVPDQELNTTSSPSFALLNLASGNGTATFGPINSSFCHVYTDRPAFVFDKSISCNPASGLDLGLSNRYWRHLYMNGNIVINGTTFVDSSRNVAANCITTGQGSTFDLWQFSGVRDLVYNGKRVMVLREDWSPTTMVLNYGADFGRVLIDSPLEVNGNINCGRLYLTSGDVATDMVIINNTSATAGDRVNLTINRTNQYGNQLYLSLYDAKNSKWGGLSCGPIRINNTTLAIDSNNDHFARYMNLTGTGNQFRCDNRIVVRNTNSTAYQDMDMRRLYISGSVAIGDGKNAALGSISANGRIDLSGGAPLFYFAETDQTLPAGRWRMGVDGDALLIDHNTALDGGYSTRQRTYFNNYGFYTYGIVQGQIGAYMANTTLTMSASSTVQFNNSTYRSTTITSSPGTMVKRLKVNYAMTGTFYIKWSLVSQSYGTIVYGRLYKNGTAVGSQRSISSDTGATYTEGPFTNITAGDEFQIQAWTSDPNVQVGVWDLQICFTPSSAVALYSALS